MINVKQLEKAIALAKALGVDKYPPRPDDHNDFYAFYLEHHVCPRCGSEVDIDSSGSNERDSSNDVHNCVNKKCGWHLNEMGIWLYEAEQRKKKGQRE